MASALRCCWQFGQRPLQRGVAVRADIIGRQPGEYPEAGERLLRRARQARHITTDPGRLGIRYQLVDGIGGRGIDLRGGGEIEHHHARPCRMPPSSWVSCRAEA